MQSKCIFRLTKDQPYEMQVRMWDVDKKTYGQADYARFWVSGSPEYRLFTDGFTSQENFKVMVNKNFLCILLCYATID